jgi:HD-GYP domain-containing protein (c-di-GMP phosphodiesterase class II)
MSDDIYKAISLDTLLPETLPGVALFVKHNTNYVLYKASDMPFTEKDKARLIDRNTRELHVYSGELSDYNQYVEANLPTLLQDVSLPPKKRQEILCQASINYVQEVFNIPSKEIKKNMGRSKAIIRHILNDKLEETSLFETLAGLVDHSSYTYVHSVQVCAYTISLHAQIMKLTEEELIDIGVGALFHDYGKIYIPLDILDKPDKLTHSEFDKIKKHCDYGYDMLKMHNVLDQLSLNILKHHHEKVNGKGYPEGLKGHEISKNSKIAAIADVYSALTTTRPYRQALDRESALDIMCTSMEGSFDVYYLSSFAAMLSG